MSDEVLVAVTVGWVLASAIGLTWSTPALIRAYGDLRATPANEHLGRRQAARNRRAVAYRAGCIAASFAVASLALAVRLHLLAPGLPSLVELILLSALPLLLMADAIDHEHHQDALKAAGSGWLAAQGIERRVGGQRSYDLPAAGPPRGGS